MFNLFKKKEVELTYAQKYVILFKSIEHIFNLFPDCDYESEYVIINDCISWAGKPHEAFYYNEGTIGYKVFDEAAICLVVEKDIFDKLTPFEFGQLLLPKIEILRQRFSSQAKKLHSRIVENGNMLTIHINFYGIIK
jgi:hypothetical protein